MRKDLGIVKFEVASYTGLEDFPVLLAFWKCTNALDCTRTKYDSRRKLLTCCPPEVLRVDRLKRRGAKVKSHSTHDSIGH